MTYEPPGPGPYWTRPGYGPGIAAEIDTGLRQYMVRVYSYMAAGLGISGIVAHLAVATGFYQQIVRDTAYLDRHAGAAGSGTLAQLWC